MWSESEHSGSKGAPSFAMFCSASAHALEPASLTSIAMNIFCRIFGHTVVHKVDDPKIRWATSKSLSELVQTTDGEPEFYTECARCGERGEWSKTEVEVRLAKLEAERPAADPA